MGTSQSGMKVPDFLQHKLPLKPELPFAKNWREDICPFLYRFLDYIFLHTVPVDQINAIMDNPEDPDYRDLSFLHMHAYRNDEHKTELKKILCDVPKKLEQKCSGYKEIPRYERNVNEYNRYILIVITAFVNDKPHSDASHYAPFAGHNFDNIRNLKLFIGKLEPILCLRNVITEFLDRIEWHPKEKICTTFLKEETYTDLEIIEAIEFNDPALSEMRDSFVLAERWNTNGDHSGFDINGCMDFFLEMNVHVFLRDRHLTLTEFILKWDNNCQDFESMNIYSVYGFNFFLAHFEKDYWNTVPNFHNWLKQTPFHYHGRVIDEKN